MRFPAREECRDARPASSGKRPARSPWADSLHVFVLSAFAVAQPAYDRLGGRAEFLSAMRIEPAAVLVVVGLITLGLPLALVLIERIVAWIKPSAYNGTHAIIVFVQLALIAATILRMVDYFPLWVFILAAVVAGALATQAYFRLPRLRLAVSLAAPGILIFPLHLWFNSSLAWIVRQASPLAPQARPQVPVVVVVLDELCGASLMTPERQIDADRFPHFAELARHATWYRNATTVHGSTWEAVPAILAGRRLRNPWPPSASEMPQNIFNVLHQACGYELAAFEPISRLAPVVETTRTSSAPPAPQFTAQVGILLDAMCRAYLYQISPIDCWNSLPLLPRHWFFGIHKEGDIDPLARRGVFRYGSMSERSRQIEHFLQCLDGSPEPALYFLHLVLPHVPWCYLPGGERYRPDGDFADFVEFTAHNGMLEFWGLDALVVAHSQQRYLLQTQYVDALIGRMLDRLRETGMFDRCLLVVVADHGVSFRPGHPRRAATKDSLADILSVPFFLKLPGQTSGGISDRRVETVDILPTIADVLGISLRDPTDGWSVVDNSRPDRSSKMYAADGQVLAIDPQAIVKSDIPAVIRGRFGDPRDPGSLYRLDVVPELAGVRIEDLPTTGEPPLEIELIEREDPNPVPGPPMLRCYLEGRVHGAAPADEPVLLAIVADGTIRAVTRTFTPDHLRDRFAVLLPPSLTIDDVQIHSLRHIGAEWRAMPCRVRTKYDSATGE